MKKLLRDTIYYFCYVLSTILNKRTNLVVICIHSISNDGWHYSIPKERLIKQIETYKKNGYKFVDITTALDYIDGKINLSNAILLTVDDGYADILDIAPELQKNDIKPLLFILSNRNNFDNVQLGIKGKNMLDVRELQKIINYKWSLGSHGATHADFTTINNSKALEEVKQSKLVLEKELGINFDYFSYPKGNYSQDIIDMVKTCRYKAAFSMDDAIIFPHHNRYILPRVGLDNSHSITSGLYTISYYSILFRKIIKSCIKKTSLERLIR